MIDITHKSNTLREATAQAIVNVGSKETIERIRQNTVPKGNIFEMAKAAGLLAVKKTPDLLPDCHPLPIEFTGIEYTVHEQSIEILVRVKTIYKTGVEVEAMHGASVVALTIYDMLKPIDKNVEIGCIRLLEKTGGKSSYKPEIQGLCALVVVCSDSVSKGLAEDASGKLIMKKLAGLEIPASILIIPDEAAEIARILENASADLIIYTGGTGVGPRDITPDTLAPLMDMRLDGVEEQMRSYGQQRTPYAMFSRSLAGIKNKQVILALPGSGKGVQECMDAVFPHLLHLFHVLKGKRHDG